MNEDEIVEMENTVISYLLNAKNAFDNKEYEKAVTFLDAALVEMNAITNKHLTPIPGTDHYEEAW